MQVYTSPLGFRSAARAFATCSRARTALESVQPEPEIPLEDLEIPVSRRSLASLYGDNRIGSVRLPQELQDIVSALIQEADKKKLRQDALSLYAHLRVSSSEQTKRAAADLKGTRDPRPKNTSPPYNEDVSLAYAAGLMPSIYASTYRVLSEIRKRTENDDWSPKRLVDWGSGTASAAWAAKEVWPTIRHYVGLDEIRPMHILSTQLLEALRPALQTKLHQTSFANPNLPTMSSSGEGEIAIAAYTLGDIKHPDKRKHLVERMWDSEAEMIVLVDRGTPAGFQLIAEARAHVLKYAKNECHIIAPCSHEKSCPLRFADSFCHFGQRLERPDFLRKTKHSTNGEEDSKFSYVVFRRGPRPASSHHPNPHTLTKLGPLSEESVKPPVFHEQPEELFGERPVFDRMPVTASPVVIENEAAATEEMRQEAFSWPRIVAPPMKRSGHVVFDVCAASGDIERFTIPKSQGKQAYSDARKSHWGDLFPHLAKNGNEKRPKRRGAKARDSKDGGLDALRGFDMLEDMDLDLD